MGTLFFVSPCLTDVEVFAPSWCEMCSTLPPSGVELGTDVVNCLKCSKTVSRSFSLILKFFVIVIIVLCSSVEGQMSFNHSQGHTSTFTVLSLPLSLSLPPISPLPASFLPLFPLLFSSIFSYLILSCLPSFLLLPCHLSTFCLPLFFLRHSCYC